MLTVNHDKINEISKAQKERFQKLSEAIKPQGDTNQVPIKSEDNFADSDSSIICTPTNESNIKLPEEG
jgi:hypothetical protein